MENEHPVDGNNCGSLRILRTSLDVGWLGTESDDRIPGCYVVDHRPAHAVLEVT